MNAAKRKVESGPGGMAARFLPLLQRPYRRAFDFLMLVAGLSGGAYYGWQRVGPQITQGPEYLLEPERIEITPPPPWIRCWVGPPRSGRPVGWWCWTPGMAAATAAPSAWPRAIMKKITPWIGRCDCSACSRLAAGRWS